LKPRRAAWALGAAAVLGATGCATVTGGGPSHPATGQPADAFSMAQPRCDAQGRQPELAHKDRIRNVRIGGQPVYRGTSIVCE